MADFGNLVMMEAEYEDAKQHLSKGVLASMIKNRDYLLNKAEGQTGKQAASTVSIADKIDQQIQIVASYTELVESLVQDAFKLAKDEFKRGYDEALHIEQDEHDLKLSIDKNFRKTLLRKTTHDFDTRSFGAKEQKRLETIRKAKTDFPQLYKPYETKKNKTNQRYRAESSNRKTSNIRVAQ